MKDRIEADTLGEIRIATSKKWGAQTQRSLENFPIGKEQMPLELIQAFGLIKKAAALTNAELGLLNQEKAESISDVCDELIWGMLNEEFPLSVWQTGSGTQTNMNLNEVIAYVCNEEKQEHNWLHPNDDINKSQSSNDTFPTAMQIAVVLKVKERLLPVLEKVKETLADLVEAYKDTLKIGRTHLQDATPMTFGQEISGWLTMLEYNEKMLNDALKWMYELPLGGTAVGTGLNTDPAFSEKAIQLMTRWTKEPFSQKENKFHGLSSKDQFVFFHGALKALSANVMKMANDIRWLASGPRTGISEITIPANEPGSSIMPGKVNPTQIEALTMVCVQVMGNDTTVGIAASQGNFELNVYMPVIIYNTLQSITLLADSLESFNQRCLAGLRADEKQMKQYVERSLMLVTALAPVIGYDKASQCAKQAYEESKTLKEIVLSSGLLSEKDFDKYTDPRKMV
ncbi:class II fumarate hydratase [Marinilactibacillus psychrotolerans]|uniref:Fumarate hydratase class II n=1 Tax=Marinilactibacillus psychrotolerans TaxID=191770 RepID=A0AAV3WR07_9LACT|nr:class II fumarate hydratase [Marinilactibacillus psychrotolerans]GEL66967.1 fumarate hydratase class II [Marinilactibacillus psychrotolerans]GEQ35875.1 fumarate hydratase [Marinilactibacillus psychrotolerans]SDC45342.1 fumarase, class II [Marinilactibacillus psychrotolerans]